MPFYSYDGLRPVVDPGAYVHPSAVLIGDVVVREGAYVGPCASLRGDFGRIVIGQGANIQDNCTVHSFPGRDVILSADAHVGHGAVLHGCHVGENALIGMNAIIMDNVTVGANCMVGAAAMVRTGTELPEGSLWVGAPAKLVRSLTDSEREWKKRGTAEYQELAHRCLAGSISECEPLRAEEAERPRLTGAYLPLGEWRTHD